MIKYLVGLGLTLSGLFLSGCAPEEPRTITVSVMGEVTQPAETFAISVSVNAQASSQSEALSDLSQRSAQLLEVLGQMEGLSHFVVETDGVYANALCMSEQSRYNSDRNTSACNGEFIYATSQNISVRAAPANMLGNMISLAMEHGAHSAQFQNFGIFDEIQLADLTVIDALAKARREASLIAEGLNGRVGDVLTVTPRVSRESSYLLRQAQNMGEPQQIVMHAAAPRIPIPTQPSPIIHNEIMTITFELLPKDESEASDIE
ncbi:SIMPL domain-containing protein [Woodsholea maritima]|uniref:SIMPL domain-containing protein n=1 Tax=Woodsholea maritima TaxID=240237 RepID=UPI0003A1F961|nr:SIMPL domain-containing protein [Woodsholea maritima]